MTVTAKSTKIKTFILNRAYIFSIILDIKTYL